MLNLKVNHAHLFNNGNIGFTLVICVPDGEDTVEVSIHGCTVVTGGKNGDFISMPSYKGTDGKYYSHAYVPLTEEEEEEVMKLVAESGGKGSGRGRGNRGSRR